MKKVYFTLAAVFVASGIGLYWTAGNTAFKFVESYEKIQGSLFTGFLTIGGFLLSLKAFLLLRLKQDIYDHKDYLKRLQEMQGLDPTVKRYDPLARLSRLLVLTVFCALASSLSHLTVGYVWKPYGPIVAMACSFATFVLVLWCWKVLASNIRIIAKNRDFEGRKQRKHFAHQSTDGKQAQPMAAPDAGVETTHPGTLRRENGALGATRGETLVLSNRSLAPG